MTDSLDDVGFLARSEHRFRVLEGLAVDPCERAELQRGLDVSRRTISRTLSEMEARGWIASNGWQYELTPLGAIIHEEFTTVLDATETVRTLNRVLEWLPTDAIDLDLRCFRNAAISVADRTNPTRPVREFTRLKATDGHVRALIYAVDPFQLTERRRTTATTCQRFDGVFSAGFVDTLRDSPEVARELREVIENDRFNFYQCEDEPPVHLVVTEDAVGLLLASATGTFPALLESHNETVISWANEKYERYRERATPITAEDIPIAHRRAD